MNAPSSSPTRRRFVVGGTAALIATVSGCALNNPFGATSTPAAEAVRDLSPDVALAVTAASALRDVQAFGEATRSTYPTLDGLVARFAPMHRAHYDALVEAIPDRVDTSPTAAPVVVGARPEAARRAYLDQQRRLRGTLVGLALRAESGPFALLLGSMAASVSQHLALGQGADR